MKPVLNRILAAALVLCLLLCLLPTASAEETATDITKSTTVTATGYNSAGFLTDGDIKGYKSSSGNATLTLKNSAGMAGIYLLFDLEYGAYTVTDNTSGKTFTAGKNRMLHEYIDLTAAFGAAPTSVTLNFSSGKVRLSEIYAFSSGTLPDFVQVWDAPVDGGADLLLFTTHGDDDHLFFAGMLPLYAAEKGLRVQTVYLTDNRNGPYATNSRTHEILNGLWSVGVTVYPVMGDFPDIYYEDIDQCYSEFEKLGTTKEDLQSFVTEQIRRFKPLVAVGHDINGEYGHAMHMVYTDVLIDVLGRTDDAAFFPESAETYGTWEIPKVYLHLYEENKITIDYDQPLESFDGMTAFEVSQKLGYPCHESQQWTWFTGWINGKQEKITKASQIEKFNPCEFGLYHSTVGADVLKNDFFENITTYAEQERLEQERLEQERLEQERLEQERLEKEKQEAERLEQERLEAERQEQERLEKEKQEAKARKTLELTVAIAILVVLVAALFTVATSPSRKKKRRRKKINRNF